jgi:ATP-dependent Lon protease
VRSSIPAERLANDAATARDYLTALIADAHATREAKDKEAKEAGKSDKESKDPAKSHDTARAALAALANVTDADLVVDHAAPYLELKREEMMAILLETDSAKRLAKVMPALERRATVLRLKGEIGAELEGTTSINHREKVLRDRMRQIQEELGEADDNAEVDELRAKVDNAKLPDEVRAVCKKQLARMAGMSTASPEFSIARTYVETLLDIPFGKYTDDTLDVPAARAILEAEHAGLDKIKKRILEFLAVRKLAPGKQGPILLFCGPPGVGKTSLGRSIAQSLGRKYVRISLGGVRDEAEVRGHRRTYIGALPGRIINGLKKAGSMNPVFVLDEIDKMTADMRGDPAAAMLEVLDPEQNKDFTDHYVEVPVDLSKVMFIATANSLDSIPGPLLDRMELIELPGYTAVEKLAIATPPPGAQAARRARHREGQAQLDDETLREVIHGWTREAGVRNLEREIAGCAARRRSRSPPGEADTVHLTPAELPEVLGPGQVQPRQANRKPEVGVITGLAWTPVGGDVMFIETRKYQGKGELRLTGQLGDVMKESATAAHSWVRSNAARLGIEHEHIAATDLHVHLPQGAVKKDGPSAGVALTCALVSALSGRPIRNDIAITGEVDLRGNALPVGGIKEKLLAAHRAGIKIVVHPGQERQGPDRHPPRGAAGARHPADDQDRRGPGGRPRAGSAQARRPAGDAAAGEPRWQAGGGYAELTMAASDPIVVRWHDGHASLVGPPDALRRFVRAEIARQAEEAWASGIAPTPSPPLDARFALDGLRRATDPAAWCADLGAALLARARTHPSQRVGLDLAVAELGRMGHPLRRWSSWEWCKPEAAPPPGVAITVTEDDDDQLELTVEPTALPG